jgi:HEPN domain-containing protein
MDRSEHINYWLGMAERDWQVAFHLFEKEDFSYALFFGHLTLEKIIKAIYISKIDLAPPFSHNLVYLAEKAGLELDKERLTLLEEVSDYNLEARYPDLKMTFLKRCTIQFARNRLADIGEVRQWLLQ